MQYLLAGTPQVCATPSGSCHLSMIWQYSTKLLVMSQNDWFSQSSSSLIYVQVRWLKRTPSDSLSLSVFPALPDTIKDFQYGLDFWIRCLSLKFSTDYFYRLISTVYHYTEMITFLSRTELYLPELTLTPQFIFPIYWFDLSQCCFLFVFIPN